MERVIELLARENILVPCTALLEVYYITLQEQGIEIADKRHEFIKQLPITILWEIDEPTLLTAARFKANHRVSFADSLIAGFAGNCNAVLVHKDPEFELLTDYVEMEALPYKVQGARVEAPSS